MSSLPVTSTPVPVAPPPHRRTLRSAVTADGFRVRLAPVVVVLIAAVVDVLLEDPYSGPAGIVGPLVALVGLTIVSWRVVRHAFPLFLAVFVCSYLHYLLLVNARFLIGPMPLNAVDVVVLLALAADLLRSRVAKEAEEQLRRTALTIAVVIGVLLPSFAAGVTLNGPYEALRDFRPLVFIAIAFFLTGRHASSPAVSHLLLRTMLLGGIYSMAVVVFSRVPHLRLSPDYLESRSFGYMTPTIDFAFVMAIAFLICGESFFRSRWAMRAFFALALIAQVFLFSLSAYTMLLVVPVLCLFFAPVRRSRKVIIASSAVLLIAGGAGVAVLLSSGFAHKLVEIAGQVATQYTDLSGSVHVETRLITWTAALRLVPGIRLLTGAGMGTHVFVETGDPTLGTFIAGEPTYSMYLIASGVIGVAALFWLQMRLVRVSRARMRVSTTPSMRAVRLGLAVYGLTLIINCFIHNNFMTPQISFLFGMLLAIGSRGDRAPQMAAA